jgi:hypothetical protein
VTTTSCCSTEVHPHAGVLPCTVTLKVFAANPGAAKSRSYLPGAPGTTHEVVPASAWHWAEPDAAPESVRVRPGTGPPLVEDTRTTMAIGRGHGSVRHGSLHPIHAPRATASPKTPRRPSVITLALRLPPTRSAEQVVGRPAYLVGPSKARSITPKRCFWNAWHVVHDWTPAEIMRLVRARLDRSAYISRVRRIPPARQQHGS